MTQSYAKKGKAEFPSRVFLNIDFKCLHSLGKWSFKKKKIESSRTSGGLTALPRDSPLPPLPSPDDAFKPTRRSSLHALLWFESLCFSAQRGELMV